MIVKMVVIILFGFLSVFFAFLSQRRKVTITDTCDTVNTNRYKSFFLPFWIVSFLLLALPCFFCGAGTDIHVYVQLYENFTFESLSDFTFEAGYVLLNIFLRIFFKNAYIGLGIIKVLSLFLVYKALYMIRDRVNLGFSILSYVVLLYIFNFHLLRMTLAVGIIFLALSYELLEMSKKAVVLMSIAVLMHYTALIVLLTFFVYKIMGKEIKVRKIAILSIALIVIYSSIIPIVQNIISSFNIFNKYTTYLNKAGTNIGVIQIILFIPIAYILIKTYKERKNDKFYTLNLLFGIMLLFSGSLGYVIPVASRIVYYFFWFAVAFFGAAPLIKDKHVFSFGKKRINSITMFAILYLVLQAFITYVLIGAFVSNGLTKYTLWWNI